MNAEDAPSEAVTGLPVGEPSPYAVRLQVFEGPLDLLLHLIRINEVEITDIPIARIAEQYLATLEMMRELNLEVAGDYLVMAATLAWIKSRMLLPVETVDEDGEPVDPRAELVARLLEYQRYKEASSELGERPLLGREIHEVHCRGAEPTPDAEREIEVGLFELVDAFRNVLRRAGPSGMAHEVEVETVTVRERMLAVMGLLELRDALEFDQIFDPGADRVLTRELVVATFLAVLELTRLSVLAIYQGLGDGGAPTGPIHLRRAVEPGDATWTERISDLM